MQKDSLKIRLLKHLSSKRHYKQWLAISMAALLLISFSGSTTYAHNIQASNIHTIQADSKISDPSADYFTDFGNQVQSGFNNPSDYQRFMHDLENKAPNTLGNGSNGVAWADYFRILQQDTNNTNYSSSVLSDFKNNLGLAVGTFASRGNNMYSSQTLENKVAEYSEGFFSLLTTDQANELDSFFSGLSNHQIYRNEVNSEIANQQKEKASASASASTVAKRAASSATITKSKATSAKASAQSTFSNNVSKSRGSKVAPKFSSKASNAISSASSKASSAQSVASSAKQKSSAASSASSIIRSQVNSASHALSTASSNIKHTQSAHSQSPMTMPSSSASNSANNNFNLLAALDQFNTSDTKNVSSQVTTVPTSATNTNYIHATVTKRPVAHKRTHHHITKHHNIKRHASKKYRRKQRKHASLIAYLHKHYWTNSSIKHSHYIKITRYCKLYRTTRRHKHVVVKPLYRGMTLHVKNVFRHGHTNKFKVGKHTYVTANRKFVKVLNHKPLMKHINVKR